MPKITSLPYHPNSENLFELIRHLPYASWLDSGKPHSTYGRFDIISALPQCRIVTKRKKTHVYTHEYGDYAKGIDKLKSTESNYLADPFTILSKELDALEKTSTSDDYPFIGGAIGYFGYDLARHFIDLTHSRIPSLHALPDMQVGIYHWAIVQDHLKQCTYLTQLDSCKEDIIDTVLSCLQKTTPNKSIEALTVSSLEPTISKAHYLKQLDKIQRYIIAGDCYQVNFAQCFKGQYSGHPYSAYSKLRKTMASPFSAFLSLGDQAIMSLSPERFLQVDKNKTVLAQPIKGTAPRGLDKSSDANNARELQASEKNKAENLMIVDLLRNDIGQHCIAGSIKVKNLFGLQSFPNVHHLVSDVSGSLLETSSSVDLLRDCFPGGSITGAPKKRAMEIIDELEIESRGVYCGSIGYINNNGIMDTNIAIRTVSCDGNTLFCWGGGGIVADSVAEEEYQESLDKINAILAVLSEN